MFDVKSGRTGSRRLAKAVVAGTLVAAPMGLFAAPATAAPAPAAASFNAAFRPWQNDCDHDGHWRWQNDRGRRAWSDCSNDHGHWQWFGDNHGRGDWRWQRFN